MNTEKRTEAVKWLHSFLEPIKARDSDMQPTHLVLQEGWQDPEPTPEESFIDILKRRIEADPKDWWVGYHFGLGMWFRNMLRGHGFGEKELEVENLDDYYVNIVEEAVRL